MMIISGIGSSWGKQLRRDVLTGDKTAEFVVKMSKDDFETTKTKLLREQIEQNYLAQNIVITHQTVFTIKTHKGEQECVLDPGKRLLQFYLFSFGKLKRNSRVRAR